MPSRHRPLLMGGTLTSWLTNRANRLVLLAMRAWNDVRRLVT
jgi:hypothetical protein